MHLNLTFTGKKDEVLEQLRAPVASDDPQVLTEQAVKATFADHIEKYASAKVPISIRASISLVYGADLTNDGEEKAAAEDPAS